MANQLSPCVYYAKDINGNDKAKWTKIGVAGAWAGPFPDARLNFYGSSCVGPYSWCSQVTLAGRAPTLDPASTGICEAFDFQFGCAAGDHTVTITIGMDRLAACGF